MYTHAHSFLLSCYSFLPPWEEISVSECTFKYEYKTCSDLNNDHCTLHLYSPHIVSFHSLQSVSVLSFFTFRLVTHDMEVWKVTMDKNHGRPNIMKRANSWKTNTLMLALCWCDLHPECNETNIMFLVRIVKARKIWKRDRTTEKELSDWCFYTSI